MLIVVEADGGESAETANEPATVRRYCIYTVSTFPKSTVRMLLFALTGARFLPELKCNSRTRTSAAGE